MRTSEGDAATANGRGGDMRDARLNGKLITASPHSPDVAICPACGGEVRKRRREVGRSEVTYFYRHNTAEGIDCPLRYTPVSVER